VTWLDPEVPIWFNDFEGAVRTFGSLDETSLRGGLSYELLPARTGAPTGSASAEGSGAAPSAMRGARASGSRPSTGPRTTPLAGSPEEFFDGRPRRDRRDANFLLSRELSGGSYDAFDDLAAGFLMAEVNLLERVRLVGGARVEHYTCSR
jgi:hypothetical protein